MDKQRRKILRRRAGWIVLRISSFLIEAFKLMPLSFTLYVGRIFGILGYIFSKGHREIAYEALNIAFAKEKEASEIKAIARKCFEFMGEASWELFYFLKNPRYVKERIEIVGKENLVRALKNKKGVIGISAHLGNFPLLCMRLKEEGFVVNTMVRPMRDEKAGEFVHELRQKTGVKTIFSYPRKEAVFNSLKALKDNEIIVIQMDQNFGTGGVWVKFFDKLAATPVGPIVLALRSEAAIVPMYIVRTDKGRHTIFIEEEVVLEKREDKDEAVLLDAVKITNIIERWVRNYPEFWGWIHRRWKSRPTEKVYRLRHRVQPD